MKKLFLLSTIMILSTVNVNAMNWQQIDTKVPNIDVFVDLDTVKNLDNYRFQYAIKYQALGQSEKIAYIIADTKNNKLGVIQAGDYDIDKYRPNAVFDNPQVFMKPIKDDSFLYYANDYAAMLATDKIFAGDTKNVNAVARNRAGNDLLVSYTSSIDAKNAMTPLELEKYYQKTCPLLKENWNPPASGNGTKTVVIATIGTDGSLVKHKIIESSGNDTNDRSVIAALEKTVLFPQYATAVDNVNALNFQFIFVNDVFKKSVVY